MTRLPIGIQLYTVREQLQGDFEGTLKALADLGYAGVEFAGNYGGKSPQELSGFISGLGLVCCGLHASLDDILEVGSDAYTYAAALDSPYLTTSLCGEVEKDWLGTIDRVAAAGAVATSVGRTFTYHNHAQEFEEVNGRCALDLLYESTDAGNVKAELDTFWIMKGGADPVGYIRKFPGRVPQVHLKDMSPDDGTFTELGTGLMDLPGVFSVAGQVGAAWIIYEQDTCKGDPLDSARVSLDNLRSAGLV